MSRYVTTLSCAATFMSQLDILKDFMPNLDIYYRRNLPHYHLEGYPLFITFRLFGSLPIELLAQLKTQRELDLKALNNKTQAERHEVEKMHFERYDGWLDRAEFGPRWLQSDNIAQIVAKEIHNLNGDRYRMIAYCIMPNHVHLLIESSVNELSHHQGKSAKYPVTETLRLLKGRTARYCNLELMQSGSFWQHESYDRVVHNEQQLENIILYILNNPVKAGLVNEWKNWTFTYISPELGEW
jgi:REP element-mobilizing transposase RayT